MKKFGVYATTAVGATAVSMAFFGTGIAAADDYAGQTYSDASSAISDAGKKAVIASRAGDTLSDDDCIVTHSQSAPWIKGDDFAPVTDTVLVYLNCNATVATAKDPGNSAGSPEGRAAIAAAQKKQQEGSPASPAPSCAPPFPGLPAAIPSRVRQGIHEREARSMRLQVLPYVTVEIDDRLRRRLRRAGERLRVNVRAYLLSAADDVDAAGDKVRDLCDRAVNRVDSVVADGQRPAWRRRTPAAAASPGCRARSQLAATASARRRGPRRRTTRRSPPGPRRPPEWPTPVDSTPPIGTG